jgi:hypothetical protein
MATKPISATLQELTLARIDERVGPRGVSAYLEAAAQEKLDRDDSHDAFLAYLEELEAADPSTPEQIEAGRKIAADILACES